MEIRTVLLSSFVELDNGVHPGVPVEVLVERAQRRHLTPEDFFVALKAALHDGDLIESSPGMLSLTPSGAEHYQESSNTG